MRRRSMVGESGSDRGDGRGGREGGRRRLALQVDQPVRKGKGGGLWREWGERSEGGKRGRRRTVGPLD